MQSQEKPEFFEILAGLSEIFDKVLSKPTLEIYWNALKEYTIDDFKKATNNIVRTYKYASFPKPAEFIEYINPLQDIEAKAEFAMDEFWEHFNDSGHESFEWGDPVLAMTVEHYGGWGMILDTMPRDNLKDQIFWIKDFKKTYAIFVRFPRKKVRLRFIGLFESDNTAKGYLTDGMGHPIPLPDGQGYIMIGSPEAQKLVDDKTKMLLLGDRKA